MGIIDDVYENVDIYIRVTLDGFGKKAWCIWNSERPVCGCWLLTPSKGRLPIHDCICKYLDADVVEG